MINAIFRVAKQWFSDTPESSLEQAYQAALTVKAIEEQHFNGQQVSQFPNYSESVAAYFQAEVKKYVKIARIKLAEFQASSSLPLTPTSKTGTRTALRTNSLESSSREYSAILEKLKLIDSVISKYSHEEIASGTSPRAQADKLGKIAQSQGKLRPPSSQISLQNKKISRAKVEHEASMETVTDKTGVLPRSFLRTFNRIKQEIDPNSEETEEKVLKKFRTSRNKTTVSVKFFLLLIIIPLLTHQVTKAFIVSPIVEYYFARHPQIVFVNQDLQEEAFIELQRFEEGLRFKSLLGLAPNFTAEKAEEQLREKATEVAENFRHRGADAVENIFADIFSLAAFATIIYTSKKEILIVKSFLDEIIYGLSDSAKAFLIILLTDMFVGYHSPHGWEVILEGVSRHFGLPENREFNFLFIATFPVILDTVLKYWIFRYLNRISPSAVATYRNMNE
ncbi:MAG: proton extrusion protein PcxA [Cyanophyceae cyanobacterium]